MNALSQHLVGQKVKFASERNRYTVQAGDGRYLICTKPFKARETVMYTIVDLEEGIRGTVDLVFNVYDFAAKAGCRQCLKDLQSGDVGISHRNRVELDIEENA